MRAPDKRNAELKEEQTMDTLGPNDYRQKAKKEIEVGNRVAFHWPGIRGLVHGSVTHVGDWGIRATIDKSSFNVPVEWKLLHWWQPKKNPV